MSSGSRVLRLCHCSHWCPFPWSGARSGTAWHGGPYCFKGKVEAPCSISNLYQIRSSVVCFPTPGSSSYMYTHTHIHILFLFCSLCLCLPWCLSLTVSLKDRNGHSFSFLVIPKPITWSLHGHRIPRNRTSWERQNFLGFPQHHFPAISPPFSPPLSPSLSLFVSFFSSSLPWFIWRRV